MLGAKYQGYEWKLIVDKIKKTKRKMAGEAQQPESFFGSLYLQRNLDHINCHLLPPWQLKVYQQLKEYQKHSDLEWLELAVELYEDSMMDIEVETLCRKNLDPFYQKQFRRISADKIQQKAYIPSFLKALSDYFSLLRHRVDARNMSAFFNEDISSNKVFVLSKLEELLKKVVLAFDNWDSSLGQHDLLPQLLEVEAQTLRENGVQQMLEDDMFKAKLILRMDVIERQKQNKKPQLSTKKYNNLVSPQVIVDKYLKYLDKVTIVSCYCEDSEYILGVDNMAFLEFMDQQYLGETGVNSMDYQERSDSNVIDLFPSPHNIDDDSEQNITSEPVALVTDFLSQLCECEQNALLACYCQNETANWKTLVEQANLQLPMEGGKKWTVKKFRKHVDTLFQQFIQFVEQAQNIGPEDGDSEIVNERW